MSAAEQFNPYGLHAIHIPLRLVPYQGLSWAAKGLYGRLALYRGKKADGFCAPGLVELARAMGASVDAVNRWMMELVEQKFIKRVRRGPGRAAECIFLKHPVFLDSGNMPNQAQPTDSAEMPNQGDALIPDYCGSDSAEIRNADSAEMPNPFKEENIHIENIHKDIHSSSVVSAAVTPVSSDDESRFSSEKKKEDSSSLARKMYGNGKGEFTPADRKTLIEVAQDTLRGSIASIRARYEGITQTAALKATHTPDKEITGDILNAFESFDDFQAWITDTENRGLASKARDPHAVYALYRQDAKIRAEDIHAERLKAEQRATEEAIEDEQQRAAEAAEVKLLDTPLPALQAFGLIQGRLNGHRVPAPLKAALERTGELIAPNALDAAIRGWKRCARCDDGGTVGHAFYRTLAFCTCPAGIEAAYDKGADWPTEEIARVHGSTKDKLVGAARTISVYLGDAIDASNLTETPSELVFDVPKGYRLYFKEKGFSEVFKLAGEQRTIRLMGMTA